MFEYRVAEVARLIGVSDDSVRRWIDEGRVRARRDASARVLVDGASVAEYLQRRAVAAPGPNTVEGAPDPASVRNHFTGIVTRVRSDAVMSQVDIQAGPFRVVSLVSTEAVQEMGIEVGRIVVADAKATNVSLHVPRV